MFDHTSRYYRIENRKLETADGRTIAYKGRRFLPRGGDMPLMVEVTVSQGERLDLIAARTLGDPEQFWRICDANDAIDPFELVEATGRVLRIPVPQP
jgi:hypothetical protein